MTSLNELKKFVEVFQAAGSVAEVAEKLGIDKKQVSIKATLLRKQGVNLKKFKRTKRSNADIAALNALCGDRKQEAKPTTEAKQEPPKAKDIAEKAKDATPDKGKGKK